MSTVFFMVLAPRLAESLFTGPFIHSMLILSADPLTKCKSPGRMIPHSQIGVEQAEDIACRALAFLAQDGRRLARFLDETGLRPETIRAAASEPGFLAAVLQHVAGDERLLVEFARALDLHPERIGQALRRLSPAEPSEE
jgi:hypothetical protein